MKSGTIAIFLMIAASVGCGGSSPTTPTTPTPPSNPSPSVRGTWVEAEPTTIGTVEGNTNPGNVVPFGGPPPATPPFPGTIYQQVYLGSLFGSSQVRLTEIEFFATSGTSQVASANYTFSMSATAKAVNALDTANFASNVGANPQIVFSGALGQGAVVNSRLRLTLSNPFSFAPASGNLLLQITRNNAGPLAPASFLSHFPNDGFPTGLSSRASDFSNGNAGFYLVTRFHQQRCQCPTDAPCTC